MVKKFFINGLSVPENEFQLFLDKLVGQDNWSCDETTDGGITSYDSIYSDGTKYHVRLEQGGANEHHIDRVDWQKH